MAKEKTVYVCNNCGQEMPKWVGRCPSCGEWNTFKEMTVRPAAASARHAATSIALGHAATSRPIALTDISAAEESRQTTGDAELDRVLGGGIVPGSLILMGGEPGIGKSTLLLQTILRMTGRHVLYVSGEESERQIKLRADRLGTATSNCLLLCETQIEQIFTHIKNVNPDLLVIDSIQTMTTEAIDASAGSISQIRECTTALLKYAKESGTPVILIGHITKDGAIAGPKILEHMVDTVLQFEGDQHYMYRIVRAIKNRFGSTAELAIYEMLSSGLRPVVNPSELLLSDTDLTSDLSGVSIACAIEGVRPLLIETQALVSSAAYGTPQRSATGFDMRRLNMLLAVLEKRVGFKLAQKDVYLNIAGGLRVTDPATDLSVIASVLSSNLDMALPRSVCLCGEVGLSGEIRPVSRILQRVGEAQRLGFESILVPSANMTNLDTSAFGIRLQPVRKVEEALRVLFG